MIETFILYNAILLLSVLFAYYAEHSKTRRSRILARYSLFMVLFVPSVLRYDIGTDYASYVDSFNFSSEYKQTEIVFYALILFLRNLQLPAHSLFVCSAFITYFPLLFLQRKNYTWKILMYVLLCYLLSYSAIRNMISLSLVILAFDLFFRGKRWGAFIIYPLSVLFHASSFVFLPFFFVNRMHCNRIILLLISSFLLCICYTDMFFVLLNNDLFLNSYYGGYMFSVYGVEPSYHTGYGAFSKILFAAIVFLSVLFSKTKDNAVIYFSLFYFISLVLMTKVSIFLRLADAAAITLVFALPLCLSVWREKKIIALKYLMVLFYVVLFEMFIYANNRGLKEGNVGVSPYQTIFCE